MWLWFPRQHVLIRASIHEDRDKAQTNALKGVISDPLYLHRTTFSERWHPPSADKNTRRFRFIFDSLRGQTAVRILKKWFMNTLYLFLQNTDEYKLAGTDACDESLFLLKNLFKDHFFSGEKKLIKK